MHDLRTAPLFPKTALVFFGDHQLEHVQVYDFEKNAGEDGAYHITNGRPLTRSGFRMLLEQFLDQYRNTIGAMTFIDPRVLYYNPAEEMMAWHVPASKRIIYMGHEHTGFEVKMPQLLMVAKGRSLYVYALAGKIRPTPDAPVYHAPLWNLYDSGLMCRGNVEYPKANAPENIGQWETALFQSRFTHPNGRIARIKGVQLRDEFLFWEKQAASGTAFPAKKLVPLEMNLQQVVEAVKQAKD